MTGQQQLDAFGIAAIEHQGKVFIEDAMGGVVELEPGAARRFAFCLVRAYYDAASIDRRANAGRIAATPTLTEMF
jgi:hypothetical protein